MDGRVKTLHPKLYAGLLARARQPRALRAGRRARHRVRRPRVREPLPVRAHRRARWRDRRGRGHREHRHRRPDDDPRRGQEPRLQRRRRRAPRATTPSSRSCARPTARCRMATREALAAEAFSYTARYDTAIARWFAEKGEDFPPLHVRAFEKVVDLPYGENPHQRARLLRAGRRARPRALARSSSTTASSSRSTTSSTSTRRAPLVRDFDAPACVIVKHNNPCGVARRRRTRSSAYRRAFACDPLSAFGGVIVLNRRVDRATARGARRAVRRGAVRARLRRRRARGARPRSPTCASSRTSERRAAAARREGHAPGHRRPARPGPRPAATRSATSMEVVTGRAADRGGVGATCSSPGASAAT